jgi:hypothetical protein
MPSISFSKALAANLPSSPKLQNKSPQINKGWPFFNRRQFSKANANQLLCGKNKKTLVFVSAFFRPETFWHLSFQFVV